jgi:23S rRNA (cytosine1962-C5)-methyltransferase
VQVHDGKGRLQGYAVYSPASTITLRLLSKDAPPTAALIAERIDAAVGRRERLMPGADAYRVVHGEADFLPGVFVDRYGDAVTLQTTCGGADVLLPALEAALVARLQPRTLVLRNDAQTRGREKLPRDKRVLVGDDPVARYYEGELLLEVDLMGDQKTGGFLDQARNHVAAGAYARGEALDCFTYHGGFALQMARRGARVTAYDLSAAAVGRARDNAARAGLDVTFHEADVFDVLPALHAEGRRFDTIVLDPPAFASTQKTVDAALRAYKEINLRAMKLLRPNSILVSCSCSGRVTPADFDAMLQQAAREVRRPLHFVERWAAGPDHPVLAGVPETDYLKCRVLMVV